MDALSHLDFAWSPYNYTLGNPLNLVDPDGLSTHTDSNGRVVAVYNDGNKGVYKHKELPTGFASIEGETTTDPKTGKTIKKERLTGGELMGETGYWDEFKDHDDQTGEVKNLVEPDAQIMFGESWGPDIAKLNAESKEMGLGLVDIALNSTGGEKFDIKSKKEYAPYGEGTGKLLNGKYATARSAGNYLAGLNGANNTIVGRNISMIQYLKIAGALHVGGKPGALTAAVSGKAYGPQPYYGEIPYSGRRIIAGFMAGVALRR